MYRIDTSTGYSLVGIEQIGYAGYAQFAVAAGFQARQILPQPESSNGHRVIW